MALIVSCLAEPCQGQKLYEHIQHIFDPLDKSEMTTGILKQQSPVFLNPSRYDGENYADSMHLSVNQFGMLYGQFRNATVDPIDTLPDPSIFVDRALSFFDGDTIRLAFMAMQYDYIKNGALEDSLIAWSSGQFVDVVGRTESPYLQDTSFAFTSLHHSVKGREFKFVLPSELFFENLNWATPALEIDFDDENGFQSIIPGEVKTINYERDGTKTIKIKTVLNGITSSITWLPFDVADVNTEAKVAYSLLSGKGIVRCETITTANNDIDDKLRIELLPNPAHENTTLVINGINTNTLHVDIYDSQGKFIRNVHHAKNVNSEISIESSVNDLPAGMYFYQIRSDSEVHSLKFIKL